jgi:outer membrane biosynthesis protein TonB
MSGVVRLKVTFLETGETGEISVISRLPYGATENAIEAAKKIKFQPAIKYGKPITVSKIIEYRFKEC